MNDFKSLIANLQDLPSFPDFEKMYKRREAAIYAEISRTLAERSAFMGKSDIKGEFIHRRLLQLEQQRTPTEKHNAFRDECFSKLKEATVEMETQPDILIRAGTKTTSVADILALETTLIRAIKKANGTDLKKPLESRANRTRTL